MPISLLFTGHMIDKPDRPRPRFPTSLEEAVRIRIAQAINPFVEGVPNSDWTERFWNLWRSTPDSQREIMHLAVSDEAYRACNTHLFERAGAYGDVHLIALWDGQAGEGPGGAADLVAQARATNEPDIFSPQSLRLIR
jgi:hypothetical protein